MFGLSDIKKSRFYQEAFQDGVQQERLRLEEERKQERLQVISQLLRVGFTAERIAEILNLNVEEVRKIIENQLPDSSANN